MNQESIEQVSSRSLNRLSALAIRRARVGMHCDGGGLYLQITANANGALNRSWLYRFTLQGRERQMGLGSVENVSLADARAKAADARKLVKEGKDPIADKHAAKAALALAAAQSMTFDQCRDAYIQSHRAGWKNIKHAAQWTSTLKTYVTPVFGRVPVQSVDTGLIIKALEPIWASIPETASRVRGRIESVLDWAKARGFREGENPARWRGHLDNLLPARSKVRAVKHHAALPYPEISAFMLALRTRKAVAARALDFLILTAARTGEVIGAHWDEIDFAAKLWAVPAERMKAGRDHRVPLSEPAMAILKAMNEIKQGDYVFPGDQRACLSNMAFLMLLRRMGRNDLTAHGFRATFRTWAAEQSNFPREVIEAALAHVVGDETERAYQRGDMFEKRRRLMTAWAEYCASKPGKVVPFRAAM
jgi:integrase